MKVKATRLRPTINPQTVRIVTIGSLTMWRTYFAVYGEISVRSSSGKPLIRVLSLRVGLSCVASYSLVRLLSAISSSAKSFALWSSSTPNISVSFLSNHSFASVLNLLTYRRCQMNWMTVNTVKTKNRPMKTYVVGDHSSSLTSSGVYFTSSYLENKTIKRDPKQINEMATISNFQTTFSPK